MKACTANQSGQVIEKFPILEPSDLQECPLVLFSACLLLRGHGPHGVCNLRSMSPTSSAYFPLLFSFSLLSPSHSRHLSLDLSVSLSLSRSLFGASAQAMDQKAPDDQQRAPLAMSKTVEVTTFLCFCDQVQVHHFCGRHVVDTIVQYQRF